MIIAHLQNVLGLMLDSGFSVIVPTVGVVGLWRALWIPQDLYIIFEDDPTHFRSNAISCVLGWGSTLILLAFQVPMDKVCVYVHLRLLNTETIMLNNEINNSLKIIYCYFE